MKSVWRLGRKNINEVCRATSTRTMFDHSKFVINTRQFHTTPIFGKRIVFTTRNAILNEYKGNGSIEEDLDEMITETLAIPWNVQTVYSNWKLIMNKFEQALKESNDPERLSKKYADRINYLLQALCDSVNGNTDFIHNLNQHVEQKISTDSRIPINPVITKNAYVRVFAAEKDSYKRALGFFTKCMEPVGHYDYNTFKILIDMFFQKQRNQQIDYVQLNNISMISKRTLPFPVARSYHDRSSLFGFFQARMEEVFQIFCEKYKDDKDIPLSVKEHAVNCLVVGFANYHLIKDTPNISKVVEEGALNYCNMANIKPHLELHELILRFKLTYESLAAAKQYMADSSLPYNQHIYVLLLAFYAKAGNIVALKKTFKEIENKKIQLTPDAFSAVIQPLAYRHDLAAIKQVLEIMESLKIEANSEIHNRMATVLFNKVGRQDAIDYAHRVGEPATYASLIYQLLKQKDAALAEKVIKEMKEKHNITASPSVSIAMARHYEFCHNTEQANIWYQHFNSQTSTKRQPIVINEGVAE